MSTLVEIIARHEEREEPLLPILHKLQASAGYISEETIRNIASALNLTRAEIHGIVSFYHDFKTVPDARLVIR